MTSPKVEPAFMMRSEELRLIDEAIAAGKLRRFEIFVGDIPKAISKPDQRRRGNRGNFNRISAKNARKASISLGSK